MIGIYKITNKINKKSYIGQSRNIEKRWANHKSASKNINHEGYNYPLYNAFRKYGINNFDFSIIEECEIQALNDREKYWIKEIKPEYNQTIGGDFFIVPQKLTYEKVLEIQEILIEDIDGNISHKKLAEKYLVSKDTIRDINVGRTWYNDNFIYPLHYSKYDSQKPKEKKYCIDCGKEITKNAIRCKKCLGKNRSRTEEQMPISRKELKKMIRNIPFTQIGKKFNISDNAVRKWCDKYNLPKKVSEIKKYSDEEWELI